MAHRKDLNDDLTAAERQQLVNLMLQYITDAVVDDHLNIVHSGLEIFTGHRAYIAAMETWLAANGGGAFVPLPIWNPAKRIPAEFNVVKAEDDGTPRPALVNLNPDRPKPAQFEPPAVCEFEDGAALGDAINAWHGAVHCAIGGTMCSAPIASAAPIFWCWHAFVDHVYWDWQQCTVPCPGLTGLTLAAATRKLRFAGLRVGGIARFPRALFPRDRLPLVSPVPLPDPPPPVRATRPLPGREHGDHAAPAFDSSSFAHTSAEFEHHFLGTLRSARLQRGPLVVGQSPAEGVAIPLGHKVELVTVTE